MRRRITLLTVIALFSITLFSGCAKKTLKEDVFEEPIGAAEEAIKEEGPAEVALVEKEPPVVKPIVVPVDELSRMFKEEGRLTPIFFDYDKFSIRDDAKPVLNMIARWLKKNKYVGIRIQGHCDERGSNEYNIALGERRAQSTKNYLTMLGISPSRLASISFGEEVPADPGHSEEAWAKNRRSEFVGTSREYPED
ncbi:MAG: peptidoglycan-associated lipoprotein Pal [Thermodesulfobacteriota bacterium]